MKNVSLLLLLFSLTALGQETALVLAKNKETKLKGNEKHLYKVNLNNGELLQLHLLQKM